MEGGYNKPRPILRICKSTRSNDRLANANKAAAPRTGARGSRADAQKLHHTRRIAAAERRASVSVESRAARGGGGRRLGCQQRGPQRKCRLPLRQTKARPDRFADSLSYEAH